MTGSARPSLARYADPLAWGTLVVAAILWFAAFVALFRRDLGDPVISAAIFAGVGSLVFLAGQGAKRLCQRQVV